MDSYFEKKSSSIYTFRIAEWVSKQAEREREKEKQKQERMARRRAMPKHTFDDQSYTQHIQQNSERIEDALHQGKTLPVGCLSYLLGVKKQFKYLSGCPASKGPEQELSQYLSA